MRLAELGIVSGGVLSLLVAAVHTAFPRIFGWGPELARLSPRNGRAFYTIHVALYLALALLGVVSIAYPEDLARRGAGGALALGFAAIWAWRLVWQVVYFQPLVGAAAPRWRRLHVAWIVVFVLLLAAYGGPAASAWWPGVRDAG